jgi:serine/threonine protein phosphatase 1
MAQNTISIGLQLFPILHWEVFPSEPPDISKPKHHIFVHACLDPEADLDEQPDWLLYWESVERAQSSRNRASALMCGHTPQRHGQILDLGFSSRALIPGPSMAVG